MNEVVVYEAWLEVAQDYKEIVIASLVLPIVFLRKLLGVSDGKSVLPYLNKYFILAWVLLGTSVAFGILYESVATCRVIQAKTNLVSWPCYMPPGLTFWAYMGTFFLGIISFCVGALSSMRREGDSE